jgi:hypothetical protein
MRGIERKVTFAWAGIFLALFFGNIYKRSTSPVVPWDLWQNQPKDTAKTYYEVSNYESKKNDARIYHTDQRPLDFSGMVEADTVTAIWLMGEGRWPEWKANRYEDIRELWGGIDSLILTKEGWDQVAWTWSWKPIPKLDLHHTPVEVLYAHPLWRSSQVRAYHHYRSRVRPVRTWEELFLLEAFDSVQELLIPCYFNLNE